MTDVRFVAGVGPPEATRRGLIEGPQGTGRLPALLVSYYYYTPFQNERHHYEFRDYVLDSGAFSAWNAGVSIDLKEYTEFAKDKLANDPQLTEVFALDVIGDHSASLKNAEYMWSQGIPAIPTFHGGSPWSALEHMAKEFPKIALGGVALWKGKAKTDFIRESFARVWPKKIHGFACQGKSIMLAYPFHSVDATSWEARPCRYGRWASYGGKLLRIRGSNHNLAVEVKHYLEMERLVQHRWRKEMAMLERQFPNPKHVGQGPDLRLAYAGATENAKGSKPARSAFGKGKHT